MTTSPTLNVKDAKLRREFIAVADAFIQQMRLGLPTYSDPVTQKAGDDVFDKMAMDACIKSNLNTLIGLAFADGLTWKCAMDGPAPGEELETEMQADFDLANQILEEFRANLQHLAKPIERVAKQILRGAYKYGSKVSEIVWSDELNEGRLWLKAIKPKDRKSIGIAVDEYRNILGFVSNNKGLFGTQPIPLDEILPTERFVILTFEEEDEDPRGRSGLSPCYDWWYIKKHALPAFLKFLVQFASPSLIGKTPPDSTEEVVVDSTGEPQYDSAGNPILESPTDAMATALAQFQSGSFVVVDAEAEVSTLFPGGDGKAFIEGIKFLIDQQITYVMLGQVRATSESQFGSKADSTSAKDILDIIVDDLQDLVSEVLKHQVAYRWVFYNYGKEIADRLTPCPVLKSMPQEDFSKNATAVSSLHTSGYLSDDLIPVTDTKLFGKVRDMQAWKDKKALEQEERSQLNRDLGRLANPQDEPAPEDEDDAD